MGDIYGISNSVMEANSLHGQLALERQEQLSNYQTALDKFHKKIKDEKTGDSDTNLVDEGKDAPTLSSVYDIGRVTVAGGRQSGTRASEAFRLARTGGDVETETSSGVQSAGRAALLAGDDLPGPAAGAPATESAATGLTDAQSSFLSESGAVSAGETGAAEGVAEGVSQGAGITRSLGRGLIGGAMGFLEGAAKEGGEGAAFGSKLEGAEGIAQKVVTTAGAGEGAGFIAGKAAGAAGGLIAGGEQIDSLIESNGKSAFTRVNAQGQRVAMSGTDRAAEYLSEAGAVSDLIAAGSGGLFVPVAAALNLAGAVTGAIGAIEDEKTDDKNIGLKADGTTDATKAPKLSAAPISEAFTGLGFIGNQSHDPLSHIS